MTSRCKVKIPKYSESADGYENHMLEIIKIYSPFMVNVTDSILDYGKGSNLHAGMCYKMMIDIMSQALGSVIGSVLKSDDDIPEMVSSLKGIIVDSAMRSLEERDRHEQEAGGSEG